MTAIGEQKAWLRRVLRAADMACWRAAEEGRDLNGWATAAEISQEIEEGMDGRSVYGALHALQRAGWVEIGTPRSARSSADVYAPTERGANLLLKLDTRQTA